MKRLRTYIISSIAALSVVIISAYVGFDAAANYPEQPIGFSYATSVIGLLMGLMMLVIFVTLSIRTAYSLQRKPKEKAKNYEIS